MKYEEAPIISVVIACYNQGIYLSDALNSLEKQTFQNWEGIIVNDGSTDNTEEIALEYVKGSSMSFRKMGVFLKQEI